MNNKPALKFYFLCLLLSGEVFVKSASFANDFMPSSFSAENLMDLNHEPVEGVSTLLRYANSINMTLSASVLNSGEIYTVWFVIFNRPEKCENPIQDKAQCGIADLYNPATKSAVRWAAEAIADNEGHASFTGSLRKGKAPINLPGRDNLTKPYTAEVHLIVVPHGLPAAGIIKQEISAFKASFQFESIHHRNN